jgi:proteasome lid subunit RPN8/RPN11
VSSLDVRAIDASELRKQACPSTQLEFRIFVSEAAFDRAVARGDHDTTREIGGVLVGELLRDDAGPYLRIDDTIDALHAEEKGAELTFTHATWEHIHKEMDTRHKDKRVVGWYHTHPGFGVFLSDRDQFIQRSFFNLPFQVAFVYDPKSHDHGMFTWHDNEVWRARRYWIGAREQVWDGPRVAPDKARERAELDARKGHPGHGARTGQSPGGEREDRAAADPRDGSGQPGSLAMLITVGVILALLGGVVGHWLGVGAANQALAEAQIAVGNAKLEGLKAGVASLQSDLLGLLRDTYNDEAMHRPLTEAVAVIDQIIAALPPDSAPPAAPPAGGAPAGPGSGAGSSAPSAVAAGSGAPATAAAGNPPAPSFALQLRTARTRLVQLAQTRAIAQAELAALEAAARRGNEPSKEILRDLAEQRAGLGAIYAELATDAAKADPSRARRLLTAAALLDPGNGVRYEKQLQMFEPAGRLPGHPSEAAPPAVPQAPPPAVPQAAPQGEPR